MLQINFIADDRNYLYSEILEICLFPVDGHADNRIFPFLCVLADRDDKCSHLNPIEKRSDLFYRSMFNRQS